MRPKAGFLLSFTSILRNKDAGNRNNTSICVYVYSMTVPEFPLSGFEPDQVTKS